MSKAPDARIGRWSARASVSVGAALGVLLFFVCASGASAAGPLFAFGNNARGQLGAPANTSPNPTPAMVSLPGSSGSVTEVAVGIHSLAVTSSGQLYAFGDNNYGELGNATNNGTFTPNPMPTLVTLPGASGPVTQVAAGVGFSLAVTSTGQLYSFGNNEYGQLGRSANSGTTNPNPTPALVTLPGASGPVTRVAAGQDHGLALTSTGQLYAFGNNGFGQLGSTTNSGNGNPNPMPALVTLPGAGGPVTQIAAGRDHSLAVTSTGQLYAFGKNQTGQLGNNTNIGTTMPNPTPTLVTLPGASGPVTQIAAGAFHSLAVTSTGQLYAFGNNFYGQLGNTTNNGVGNSSNPMPTLVTLPGAGGPVTRVAAARIHSLAATSTGQLYAFGDNFYGQLGSTTNNNNDNANPTPTLVALPAGTSIDTVAKGENADYSLVVGAVGVSVSAVDLVPEPASGSVPATFTISLAQPSGSAVTIHYETLDGTATAAANAYTAIPDGSITIPAGQTSVQIQVQVGNGSGQATTQTESFQVHLTSSDGPPITTDSATGVITVPGISGKVTDASGDPQPGYPITLTGTAASGQPVTQHLVTDGGGRYQLYADPGAYTVTPAPPAAKHAYEAVGCPGTATPGACTQIALGPAANLTVDFKLLGLVVNSTATDRDPQASLDQNVCDTTPAQPQQTCTLPAAIDLANKLGGGTIGFDIPGGGVPVISVQEGMPPLTAPAVIDGATQPGGGMVELTDPGGECASPGDAFGEIGLDIRGGNTTVRGMVINGYGRQIQLTGPGHDTIVGNRIGTDPSGTVANYHRCYTGSAGVAISASSGNRIGGPGAGEGNLISGNAGAGIREEDGVANVIQGNTVGPALGGTELLTDKQAAPIALGKTGDPRVSGSNTVGGAGPAAGNLFVGFLVHVRDDGNVIQGNTFSHVQFFLEGSHNTIGGATQTPGSGLGNEFTDTPVALATVSGDGNVLQGNMFQESGVSGVLLENATHTTIGGARPELGNLIDHVSLFPQGNEGGGIQIGQRPGITPSTPSSQTLIENNTITRNHGDGGVVVYEGTGNTIVNAMSGNRLLGINLGGGGFRYNGLNSPAGPNNFQRYPNILGSTGTTTIKMTGRLDQGAGGHNETFTFDLYSQPRCARNSLAPGQGERLLGQTQAKAGLLGTADFAISFPKAAARGDKALTATATAADGSTSEFSPCQDIGHQALAFVKNGVQVQDTRVDLTTNPAPKLKAAADQQVLHGALHSFCPPKTERSCTGAVALSAGARTVARLSFKLAPGQLGTLKLRVPAKLLGKSRKLKVHATTTAHDAAKHRHTKRTTKTLTLVKQKAK